MCSESNCFQQTTCHPKNMRSCPQASYRILHSWGFDLAFFIHVFHVKLEYSYKYKMLQALVIDTQVWHVWQVNAAPLLLRWQRGDRDIDATEELLVTKLNIQSVGIGGLHACMLASHFLIFLGRHQQARYNQQTAQSRSPSCV